MMAQVNEVSTNSDSEIIANKCVNFVCENCEIPCVECGFKNLELKRMQSQCDNLLNNYNRIKEA